MDTGYNMLSTTTRSTLLIPSGARFRFCWGRGFGSKPPPLFIGFPKLFKFSPAKADARSPEDAKAAAASRLAIWRRSVIS
jgi:hypothetical protein